MRRSFIILTTNANVRDIMPEGLEAVPMSAGESGGETVLGFILV